MGRTRYIALLIVILLSNSSASTQSSDGSKYIGYKYRAPTVGEKLPNGFEHHGGGLIGDSFADPVYGISILKKGKTTMFWLEVSTARQARGGVTEWEVKDSLEFSNLRPTDYVLEISPAFECKRGKTTIENLIGLGMFNERRAVFTPRKLWFPNAKTAKFETVSVRNVKCFYNEP